MRSCTYFHNITTNPPPLCGAPGSEWHDQLVGCRDLELRHLMLTIDLWHYLVHVEEKNHHLWSCQCYMDQYAKHIFFWGCIVGQVNKAGGIEEAGRNKFGEQMKRSWRQSTQGACDLHLNMEWQPAARQQTPTLIVSTEYKIRQQDLSQEEWSLHQYKPLRKLQEFSP